MSGSHHDHPELGPPTLVEVAEHVYAYIQPDGSWWINNTGFIVGDRAVISVDACSTERRTRQFRQHISEVTSAPVATLINTHHHGDHTFGNYLFAGATIVGHDNCRTEVLRGGLPSNRGIWTPVEWGAIELAPPTLTFADRVTIWSDDIAVEVRYVGQAAHTNNDSLVWIPDKSVLFCGDLIFSTGGTPFLLMGSVAGAICVLTDVVKPIPARVIVPGHGEPCGPEVIDTVIGYLRFVLDTAERGIAAGLSPLDTARQTDLREYDGWLDRERIVGNLHRAYCDLDPSRPDLDLHAALGDMISYNGGQPLSCYA